MADKFTHLGPAPGQCPGFVKHHGLHLLGGLQRGRVLDQHAKLRSPAGADHDRGRRGQTHRAGTGNYQHRDKKPQRHGELDPADEIPAQAGDERDAHHDRHEVEADPIGQRADRRLAALGLADHSDDPSQHRIAAGLSGFDAQHPGLIERAAEDAVFYIFLHRQALAGEHRLIQRRTAPHDRAVDRDALAGPDQQDIARLDFIGGNGSLGIALDQGGGVRGELHQLGDRIGGVKLRARFEIFTQVDQRDQHPRRLEVEIHDPHLHIDAQADLDQSPGRVDKGRAGAHRDQ